MKREKYGDGYDGEIDAKTEPGEKGALVGEVVACSGGFIREEERRQKGEMGERIAIRVTSLLWIMVPRKQVSEVEGEVKQEWRHTDRRDG